jgi:hypothetical protein
MPPSPPSMAAMVAFWRSLKMVGRGREEKRKKKKFERVLVDRTDNGEQECCYIGMYEAVLSNRRSSRHRYGASWSVKAVEQSQSGN